MDKEVLESGRMGSRMSRRGRRERGQRDRVVTRFPSYWPLWKDARRSMMVKEKKREEERGDGGGGVASEHR